MHAWKVTAQIPVFLSHPYSLDLPLTTPEDTPAPYYKIMTLSDISDLQDVMTTTSDEGIPDLEDIFRLWIMDYALNELMQKLCESRWIHLYTLTTCAQWI